MRLHQTFRTIGTSLFLVACISTLAFSQEVSAGKETAASESGKAASGENPSVGGKAPVTSYDSNGRTKSSRQPDGTTILHAYDANGNLRHSVGPDGKKVSAPANAQVEMK